jgi:F-type H+-transporting ATPase subunit alpha
MIIFAGNQGFLDEVPVNQVGAWEKAFLQYMRDVKGSVRALLAEKKDITPDVQEGLVGAIGEFKKGWKPAAKA